MGEAPRDFSAESVALVKETWAILQVDAQANAVAFFRNVFEIAPAAKGFFDFMKDESIPMEKNAKLKFHALQVFRLTGDSAAQLGDKGAFELVEPRLQRLGAKHLAKGVGDAHFEVVKAALLKTIKEGLPEKWSPALESAWGNAYDALATVLKKEIHKQAAAATPGTAAAAAPATEAAAAALASGAAAAPATEAAAAALASGAAAAPATEAAAAALASGAAAAPATEAVAAAPESAVAVTPVTPAVVA